VIRARLPARARRRLLLAAAAAAGLVVRVFAARADALDPGLPDPPVDAAADGDVVFERAAPDTGDGVEVGFGLRGLGRGGPRTARTVRFLGDDFDGTVRDGTADPLAGAEIGGASPAGAWRVGRAAPQWGCGWLVGAPLAPWGDAQGGSLFRSGPRGDVATFSAGEFTTLDAMIGRFAKHEVAAVRAGTRGISLALAAHRGGLLGAGVALEDLDQAGEATIDRAGRWRGEIAIARDALRGRVGLRARGGSAGFRPLLAPTRGGPPEALGADWSLAAERIVPRVSGALWRFGNGLGGARGRLEVDLRLVHHAAWSLGLEEQRGTQRETTAGHGMRQGWWGEWLGHSGPIGLVLGLESWGNRSRARSPVRAATLAALEVRTPLGGALHVEERAFRSGSGEGYRAPELEDDRLVLQALSGAGERTRIDLTLPGPAGRLRAGWTLTATASQPSRPQWTLNCTRRARVRAAPSEEER